MESSSHAWHVQKVLHFLHRKFEDSAFNSILTQAFGNKIVATLNQVLSQRIKRASAKGNPERLKYDINFQSEFKLDFQQILGETLLQELIVYNFSRLLGETEIRKRKLLLEGHDGVRRELSHLKSQLSQISKDKDKLYSTLVKASIFDYAKYNHLKMELIRTFETVQTDCEYLTQAENVCPNKFVFSSPKRESKFSAPKRESKFSAAENLDYRSPASRIATIDSLDSVERKQKVETVIERLHKIRKERGRLDKNGKNRFHRPLQLDNEDKQCSEKLCTGRHNLARLEDELSKHKKKMKGLETRNTTALQKQRMEICRLKDSIWKIKGELTVKPFAHDDSASPNTNRFSSVGSNIEAERVLYLMQEIQNQAEHVQIQAFDLCKQKDEEISRLRSLVFRNNQEIVNLIDMEAFTSEQRKELKKYANADQNLKPVSPRIFFSLYNGYLIENFNSRIREIESMAMEDSNGKALCNLGRPRVYDDVSSDVTHVNSNRKLKYQVLEENIKKLEKEYDFLKLKHDELQKLNNTEILLQSKKEEQRKTDCLQTLSNQLCMELEELRSRSFEKESKLQQKLNETNAQLSLLEKKIRENGEATSQMKEEQSEDSNLFTKISLLQSENEQLSRWKNSLEMRIEELHGFFFKRAHSFEKDISYLKSINSEQETLIKTYMEENNHLKEEAKRFRMSADKVAESCFNELRQKTKEYQKQERELQDVNDNLKLAQSNYRKSVKVLNQEVLGWRNELGKLGTSSEYFTEVINEIKTFQKKSSCLPYAEKSISTRVRRLKVKRSQPGDRALIMYRPLLEILNRHICVNRDASESLKQEYKQKLDAIEATRRKEKIEHVHENDKLRKYVDSVCSELAFAIQKGKQKENNLMMNIEEMTQKHMKDSSNFAMERSLLAECIKEHESRFKSLSQELGSYKRMIENIENDLSADQGLLSLPSSLLQNGKNSKVERSIKLEGTIQEYVEYAKKIKIENGTLKEMIDKLAKESSFLKVQLSEYHRYKQATEAELKRVKYEGKSKENIHCMQIEDLHGKLRHEKVKYQLSRKAADSSHQLALNNLRHMLLKQKEKELLEHDCRSTANLKREMNISKALATAQSNAHEEFRVAAEQERKRLVDGFQARLTSYTERVNNQDKQIDKLKQECEYYKQKLNAIKHDHIVQEDLTGHKFNILKALHDEKGMLLQGIKRLQEYHLKSKS